MELTKKELDTLNKLNAFIMSGKASNEFLVQLIELVGAYLNLKTIPDYAKTHQITYNGAKYTREIVKIFNIKFIIDNR